MATLLSWRGGRMVEREDAFTPVDDDQRVPPGEVVISLTRFQSEGAWLLGQDRRLGVRLNADEPPEALREALPRLALVALVFPKYRDGRPYSAARVLRERLLFTGELRAVGDVLIDQARFMIRCGFDAFEPADASTAQAWTRAAGRFRHVYQAAADGRSPAFVERFA